jgi:hypothetical protein
MLRRGPEDSWRAVLKENAIARLYDKVKRRIEAQRVVMSFRYSRAICVRCEDQRRADTSRSLKCAGLGDKNWQKAISPEKAISFYVVPESNLYTVFPGSQDCPGATEK